MAEREELWNSVQQFERRYDAQFAREFRINLPRELSWEARYRAIMQWAKSELVGRGMIADVAFHCPLAADRIEQPHVHILTTLRPVLPAASKSTWGKKAREWNNRRLLNHLRKSWELQLNEELMEAGSELRVLCSSYASRGLQELLRQPKLGPNANQKRRKVDRLRSISPNTKRRTPEETAPAPHFVESDPHLLEQLRDLKLDFAEDRDDMLIDPEHSIDDQQSERFMRWAKWRYNAANALAQKPSLAVEALIAEGRHRFWEGELRAKVRSMTGGLLTDKNTESLVSELIKTEMIICFKAQTPTEERCFTTPVGLSWEVDLLDAAVSMWTSGDIAENTEGISALTLRRLAEEIDSSGRLAVVATNVLAVGQRTFVRHLSKKWHGQGLQVIGACPTTIRAQNMQSEYGFPCSSLPALLFALKRDKTKLTSMTVLVVEDANRLTLDELKNLLIAANRLGIRMLLTGTKSTAVCTMVSPFDLLHQLCPVGQDLAIRWAETNPFRRAALQLAQANLTTDYFEILSQIGMLGPSQMIPSDNAFKNMDRIPKETRFAAEQHTLTYKLGRPGYSLHRAVAVGLDVASKKGGSVLRLLRLHEKTRIKKIGATVEKLFIWLHDELMGKKPSASVGHLHIEPDFPDRNTFIQRVRKYYSDQRASKVFIAQNDENRRPRSSPERPSGTLSDPWS